MRGHQVHRKGGWDCHGLPVELQIERKLGFHHKDDIERYGVAEFNQQCRESVLEYIDEWARLTERIAFWVDTDDAYFTLEDDYIESVWWSLKQVWEKGLLYEGHKVVPYCPRCGTALSSHEVASGYKDVEDPSVYIRFPVKGEEGVSFLGWTTTPWTLLSNAALAVHPDVDVRARPDGRRDADPGRGARRARARRGGGDRRPHDRRRPGRDRVRAAVPVHDRLRREGAHGAHGGLRDDRRRHGRRAHGGRVRRGRLPARASLRAQGAEPGEAGRHVRRADRAVRRALRQGGGPRHRQGARASRAACSAPSGTCTPTRTAGAATRRSSTTRSSRGT